VSQNTPQKPDDVTPEASTLPVGLREPAHRVSPRAVPYWRAVATITAVVVLAIAVPLYWLFADGRWWATALVALVVVWSLVEIAVAPQVRYRVHRWEVDDVAVHTREGFIGIESRIAPVNRIQTVDSEQGPLQRMFRLTTITVTTASSAGAIEIDCLDQDDAKALVARLTAITAASEGDAT
jgi:uncharacterized protein